MSGDGRRAGARLVDEGFTLIEIVMALTIFMIVFVGILTFMQSNLISSARANARTKAVNIAASYIEQVRALTYTQIGTPGGDPDGVLVAQDFTQSGVNFHLVPEVQWVDDPAINGPGGVATTHDLKRVIVRVAVSPATDSPLIASSTYALESLVSRAGGQSQPTALPTVDFDGASPAAASYISGVVHVGAVAQANAEGATLTNLNMYADDSQRGLLVGTNPAVVAHWPPLSWSDKTFQWDTASYDTSAAAFRFPDGPHNLTLQVFDSLGKSATFVRSIFVVNNPPTVPDVTLTASSSTTMNAVWNPCFTAVGSIPSARYEWDIYDQNSGSGAWQHQEAPYTGFVTGPAATVIKPERFDRYKILVRSYTPATSNNPSGFVSDWGVAYAVSRPELTTVRWANSYASKIWTTTISNPNSSPSNWVPYFPISGSPTVQYYRNSTMTTATATAIAMPYTFTTSQNRNTDPPSQYYYVAKITVQPSSNGGGAPSEPVVVWSNWVGPNDFVSGQNTSNGTMTFSGW